MKGREVSAAGGAPGEDGGKSGVGDKWRGKGGRAVFDSMGPSRPEKGAEESIDGAVVGCEGSNSNNRALHHKYKSPKKFLRSANLLED